MIFIYINMLQLLHKYTNYKIQFFIRQLLSTDIAKYLSFLFKI